MMEKAKRKPVVEVFWGLTLSDGSENPYLTICVRFQDGSEASIAEIVMPEGTDPSCIDDPEIADLAMEVANDIGYVLYGED